MAHLIALLQDTQTWLSLVAIVALSIFFVVLPLLEPRRRRQVVQAAEAVEDVLDTVCTCGSTLQKRGDAWVASYRPDPDCPFQVLAERWLPRRRYSSGRYFSGMQSSRIVETPADAAWWLNGGDASSGIPLVYGRRVDDEL